MASGSSTLRRIPQVRGPNLDHILTCVGQQQQLLKQLRPWLPASLREHCVHAQARRGELLLFVDSPAWSSRLRFLAPQLLIHAVRIVRPQPRRLIVRVLPQAVETRRRRPPALLSGSSAKLIRVAAATVTDDRLRDALRRLAARGSRSPD